VYDDVTPKRRDPDVEMPTVVGAELEPGDQEVQGLLLKRFLPQSVT
jgi:hypothetical protein